MNLLGPLKSWGIANPATLPGAALYAILFAGGAWIAGRTLRLGVQKVLAHDKHSQLDLMAIRFLAKLARYCVYLFAFIAYAHFVPALSGLGSASLTSISVITVIVGLAAQNTLGNLVAGISLLLYRPFKLGDRLQVTAPTGLETGVVENLTLGYTLLRTDDNRRVVVPNSLMASLTAINLTTSDPRVICSIPITIHYDADIDQARAALLDLGRSHPKTLQISGCPLVQLGTAGMILSLDLWCSDAFTAIALKCDVLEQARKRFARDGIHLPLPQSTLVLKDGRTVLGP